MLKNNAIVEQISHEVDKDEDTKEVETLSIDTYCSRL
jgi:hypothetical protein